MTSRIMITDDATWEEFDSDTPHYEVNIHYTLTGRYNSRLAFRAPSPYSPYGWKLGFEKLPDLPVCAYEHYLNEKDVRKRIKEITQDERNTKVEITIRSKGLSKVEQNARYGKGSNGESQ